MALPYLSHTDFSVISLIANRFFVRQIHHNSVFIELQISVSSKPNWVIFFTINSRVADQYMLNYISFSQFSPREFYLTSVLLRLYFRTILSLIQILYTNEPHYIMSEAYASLIICTWSFTTREFITTMYPFSLQVCVCQ